MELKKGTACVVIGLGASGLAAVRYLHALGMRVAVSEFRTENALDPAVLQLVRGLGVRIETGGHTEEFFSSAELIVPSPGVPLDLPVIRRAREQKVPVAGELALAAGKIKAPVIGITGSNGKTTVTSLVGHLLKTEWENIFVGGNIGTPLLEYLSGSQDARAVVLELSSFQLEIGGAFRPDIGLLLNLSPDHIDRHGSLEGYAAAKRRLFANQGKDDVAIIGIDDPLVKRERITTAGRVIRFGIHSDSEALVQESGVLIQGAALDQQDDEYYELAGTALSSLVNRLNAAAAILAARRAGCSPEAVRKGIGDFVLPPHRMTLVAEIDGVRYVDDSKGTNVGAVAAALASSGERVILIAGGRDKQSDFTLLADPVRKHVRQLVLIGEAAGRIEESLGSCAQVVRVSCMEDAVRTAAEIARPGDTVLLSPGCASFDMFRSYAHRGEVFQQAVCSLRKVHQGNC